MVKECFVKLNNDAVTVVTYDGIDIQFPSIHKDDKTVCVNYEDGRYSIVDNNYRRKIVEKNTKKNKKTTIEESVEMPTGITSIDKIDTA